MRKGPRPTLGGRIPAWFSAEGRHTRHNRSARNVQECALPGGGSGAARPAAGRNGL